MHVCAHARRHTACHLHVASHYTPFRHPTFRQKGCGVESTGTTPRLRCTHTHTYIRIRAHLFSIIGFNGAGPWLQQNWQSIRVRPLPLATGKTREMQPLLSLHRHNFLYSSFSTVESGRYYPCIFGPLLSTPLYNARPVALGCAFFSP